VRQLIKDLAQKHTVLISTHLLHEAELTCSRMIILRQGQILAEGTPDSLQEQMNKSVAVIAEVAAPLADLKKCWDEMDAVALFDIQPAEGGFHRCSLTPRAGEDLRTQVAAAVHQRGWPLRELTRNRHSLEDIYVRLTKTRTEDED
jgi:ABC-2 type transport system ATP-binding protein